MRKRYIATTLTAFAVVGYLAMDDTDETALQSVSIKGKAEPDYFIENLSAEQFSSDGRLSQQIDAVKATHYPDSDTTVLEIPSVVVHKDQLPRWGIRSDEGILQKTSDNNEILTLQGNVLIVPMNKGNTLSLVTESLHVNLNEHMANTEDEVLIENDSTVLEAVGMSLDLDAQQATFKSQVRGTHEPN